MTIIDLAKKNKPNSDMRQVAKTENVDIKTLSARIAAGAVSIPKNNLRKNNAKFKVTGIGKGLKTKVNANIGTSPDRISLQKELEKLDTAIKAGADTVMDLSTGGNLRKIRQAVISHSTIPVGTVPIYEAGCETKRKNKDITQMDPEQMFEAIERHAADKVDFITVHCGVTKKSAEIYQRQKRVCGVVSRGGAFLIKWIIANNRENPLYEQYDRLLDIAYKYDVTLSLGDGLRPGSIIDASDKLQLSELYTLAELVMRARKRNVQTIVEGPGHMPINQIVDHIKLQKRITKEAPYYLLGPLVTDVAPGYDHITSAIGAGIAASAGADFICYVTPAEHLRLPDNDDVRLGVIASRIAGHAGDIVKNVHNAANWDREFSIARKKLQWDKQQKLALDPIKFAHERKKYHSSTKNVCTMCGQFCSMRETNDI